LSKLSHIGKIRGIPFIKKGMRVFFTYSKKWGTITGTSGANLGVKFDGEDHNCVCHPTWMMQYYNADGKMIAEFKD